jgi:hypothetical protein
VLLAADLSGVHCGLASGQGSPKTSPLSSGETV